MEDKEKIEEMKDIIHNLWDKLNQDSITTDDIVDAFYNAGYRNCKDKVVLSKAKYEMLVACSSYEGIMKTLKNEYNKGCKETAKKYSEEVAQFICKLFDEGKIHFEQKIRLLQENEKVTKQFEVEIKE